MSIKVMQLVWEHAPYHDHGLILVLLALADWANDDGFCWPSMPLLAQKSRQSRRNITYLLKRLEDDEIIDLQRGNGRGHTTHYRLNVERLQSMQPVHPLEPRKGATPAPLKKGAKGAKGATSDMPHIKDARAEPSVKDLTTKDTTTTTTTTGEEEGEGRHVHRRVQEAVKGLHRCWWVLAADTPRNGELWDSLINLVEQSHAIAFTEAIERVNVYYVSQPKKRPTTWQEAANAMRYGIQLAIDDRRGQGRRARHAS